MEQREYSSSQSGDSVIPTEYKTVQESIRNFTHPINEPPQHKLPKNDTLSGNKFKSQIYKINNKKNDLEAQLKIERQEKNLLRLQL